MEGGATLVFVAIFVIVAVWAMVYGRNERPPGCG